MTHYYYWYSYYSTAKKNKRFLFIIILLLLLLKGSNDDDRREDDWIIIIIIANNNNTHHHYIIQQRGNGCVWELGRRRCTCATLLNARDRTSFAGGYRTFTRQFDASRTTRTRTHGRDMGCGASKSNAVGAEQAAAAPAAADVPADMAEYTKKFHSKVRWGKELAEVEPFIKAKPDGINCKDAGNGNTPIHIAAQNGHYHLVKFLVENNCDCNAQNGTGNTALHMAVAYDYYWCAKLLREQGNADVTIKNNDGHAATSGIDGDKKDGDWVPAMISAHNAEELNAAMKGLQSQDVATIDKAEFIQAGMAKKKSAKDIWSAAVQGIFTDIVKSL